ncbi:SH3 domain-containing protein [Duganella levis]|uniref:SH3 domain-containing protein n=1 Tax=Duganella levis TaxID=2692169 RepID=A0ABW9W6I5_9BURK|nr:SH3 domain-containing protein [Duganella levis]MYN29225.1 SH3 domain-containing protein [Duganella levis]
MDAVKLYAVTAFAAGLIVTLFLAAYLTPRAWWRRPNARALLIMVAGAWGFGSLILYATHGAASAQASPMIAATAPTAATDDSAAESWRSAAAGRPFLVHRDLNLRAAPGVHAARLAIVPAGAEATPTGMRNGDWWQIKASVNGRESTGWVSSLWLRRSGE